jgi:amino acid transporter
MANVATPPAAPTRGHEARLDADGLDRGVGFFGLLWSSEGSIIGSGWLLGALTAATVAGPSALIGWVVASFIVVLLALVHAELGGVFPVTGGTSRFPHYAFGSFAGATFGWASYLQAATVAPIEVLAAIQYLSAFHFARDWFIKHPNVPGHPGTLHGVGYAVAVALMVFFVVINLIGIRWLARSNTWITSWKVFIPVLTIFVLLITHFHGSNFSHGGGFFVHGGGGAVHAILFAIPSGGIVFALLGFEQAVQLGGEAKNPQRDLARAVIISIIIGAGIYILLQLAFVGSLDPKVLAQAHSWTNLSSTNTAALSTLNSAPFYAVAKVAGLAWLAFLLRLDGVISPAGTGLIYTTSSSRLSFGLSKNGYVPTAFEATDKRRVPVFGVVFSAIIGLLFLLPFPSWASLVSIVTSASVLMYAAAPLSLGALRRQKPDLPRVYRLPIAGVLAPLAFVCATWIIYWSGWQTVTTLMAAMLIGYALIAVSYAFNLNPRAPKLDWGAALWIIPYFAGILAISYIGEFGPGGIIGGIGPFKHWLDQGGTNPLNWSSNGVLYGGLAISAAWSLVIYFVAIARRLPVEKVDEYVRDVYPPPVVEH